MHTVLMHNDGKYNRLSTRMEALPVSLQEER